jgi:F0F1-type ATP synthase assembly protein I
MLIDFLQNPCYNRRGEVAEMSDRRSNWRDVPWALATGAQGGIMVAGPVLLGLALGYALDAMLGTLPWLTLGLALVGTMLGPVILFKWVTAVVKRRMDSRDRQSEDMPE